MSQIAKANPRAMNGVATRFKAKTVAEMNAERAVQVARRLATFTPLTIGSVTAIIHLSRKHHATIDLSDWGRLGGLMWSLMGPTHSGRLYAYRNSKDEGMVLLHRAVIGAPDGVMVDHKNNDGLDNRRANLRTCDNAGNVANSHRKRRKGMKGAYYDKDRGLWQSKIQAHGRIVFLGRFKTEQEAAGAYDVAARKFFGEFALTNEDIRERSKRD